MPQSATHPDMQYRTLGRTGEKVSAVGLKSRISCLPAPALQGRACTAARQAP
jgi:hypothetical protein